MKLIPEIIGCFLFNVILLDAAIAEPVNTAVFHIKNQMNTTKVTLYSNGTNQGFCEGDDIQHIQNYANDAFQFDPKEIAYGQETTLTIDIDGYLKDHPRGNHCSGHNNRDMVLYYSVHAAYLLDYSHLCIISFKFTDPDAVHPKGSVKLIDVHGTPRLLEWGPNEFTFPPCYIEGTDTIVMTD